MQIVYGANTAGGLWKIPSIMEPYTNILCLHSVEPIAALTLSETRDLLLCITGLLILFAMLLPHGTVQE